MGTYGAVINEIKVRSLQFAKCTYVFEGRASNFEAHNLARHVLNSEGGRHVWLGLPYSPAVNIVTHQ
jgi:hypothetical protein